MNLNGLLIIFAFVMIYNVVQGYKKGMVRSVISLFSLIALCVVIALVGNAFSNFQAGQIGNTIILVLLLVILGILQHVLNVVFFSAKVISKLPIIHFADKIMGCILAVAETVFILWTVYMFMGILNLGEVSQWLLECIEKSKILSWFYNNNMLAVWVHGLGVDFSWGEELRSELETKIKEGLEEGMKENLEEGLKDLMQK